MPMISRQLALPYSAAQMYALVNDVARYPEFVPWCVEATIHHADEHAMRASLIGEFRGVRSSVTTTNQCTPNQSIVMNLEQGMVKHLTGQWQFVDQGDHASLVKLSVDVEFKNRLMNVMFKGVMQQVLNRITDAFCARAKKLYG